MCTFWVVVVKACLLLAPLMLEAFPYTVTRTALGAGFAIIEAAIISLWAAASLGWIG